MIVFAGDTLAFERDASCLRVLVEEQQRYAQARRCAEGGAAEAFARHARCAIRAHNRPNFTTARFSSAMNERSAFAAWSIRTHCRTAAVATTITIPFIFVA